MPLPAPDPASLPPPPAGWRLVRDADGSLQLTHAVRGGATQRMLLALGGGLLLLGLYGCWWLLAGGDLTVAGYVFVLVPAGLALFGVYVLDVACYAHTRYRLDSVLFTSTRVSLFGRKETVIPRGAIRGVLQQYTPPGTSAPAGHPGDWTTFVTHRALADGEIRDLPLAGLNTPEEARWLGPLLAGWCGVPLRGGFGTAHEEADAGELPDLHAPDRAQPGRH